MSKNRVSVSRDGSKFKVSLNFIQHGVSVSTAALANKLAEDLAGKTPNTTLGLFKL